jgi:ubiquinone/menaquinone biosynthesis C-methylase UbiE
MNHDQDGWRRIAAEMASELELAEGESVFEVGCGAGALLLPLYEAGCRVGGIDPSADRIAAARTLMPEGRWLVGDASALDPAEPYDVVMARGAFDRFPDQEYARGVLARMAAKATRAVAVLEVLETGETPRPPGGALAFDRLWFLRMLDQVGASAVQIGHASGEAGAPDEPRFHVFARV